MNIKSLLLGSAAALAVFPALRLPTLSSLPSREPMEYVRVCDAYGTGFLHPRHRDLPEDRRHCVSKST